MDAIDGVPCPYCESPYRDCAYWCYTRGAGQQAMWTDRNWFLAHPDADEYWRELQPFDISCKTFNGVMFVNDEVPRMKVTRINDHMRVRHYPFEQMAIAVGGSWLDEKDGVAPLRFFQTRGLLAPANIKWKPTPKSFPSEFPGCESPPEKMFYDAINDAAAVELAYLVPQFEARVAGENYRLDFAVVDRRLCIEIDGLAYHNGQDSFMRDRRRERALQMDGWRVLRFAAKEVMQDAASCVRQAAQWAATA